MVLMSVSSDQTQEKVLEPRNLYTLLGPAVRNVFTFAGCDPSVESVEALYLQCIQVCYCPDTTKPDSTSAVLSSVLI